MAIRDDGVVSNKAVYLALGIQADGQRDVLDLWIEQTGGAKFWLKVFNELKARGHFPNDEAAIKLLWMALRNVLAKSVCAAFDRKSATSQFAILFGDRFTQACG